LPSVSSSPFATIALQHAVNFAQLGHPAPFAAAGAGAGVGAVCAGAAAGAGAGAGWSAFFEHPPSATHNTTDTRHFMRAS
jgi:hypothetical protein